VGDVTTQDELLALRDATRLAHEVLADLKAEHRAIKVTLDVLRTEKEAWQREAQEHFKMIVKEGLDGWSKSLDKAIQDSTARVFKRFDTLADIMMGEVRGDNQESLAVLIHKWRTRHP
jgi:hypothetical protein